MLRQPASLLAWLLAAALVARSAAHPKALQCDDEDATKMKVGQTIMKMPVVESKVGALLELLDSDGKPVASYTPGTAVAVRVSGLPSGAFLALRASRLAGEFSNLQQQVNLTADCKAQLYSSTAFDPATPVTASWATAEPQGDVTFSLVWSSGPGTYTKFTSSTLKGPAPTPTTPAPSDCTHKFCTMVLAGGKDAGPEGLFKLSWKIDEEKKLLHASMLVHKEAWVAFGISPTGNMPDSEVVIAKPVDASASPWLLGQYDPNNFKPLKADPIDQFGFSQVDGMTTVMLTRPFGEGPTAVNLQNGNHVIFAAGFSNTFGRHQFFGSMMLDWRQGSGTADTSGGLNKWLLFWHVVLMVVAWGVLLPLGAMVARYCKSRGAMWFRAHRSIQSLGLLLAVAGAAAIITAYAAAERPQFSVLHGQLGLVVLVLAVLQPLNSFVRPHPEPKTFARLLWEYVHRGGGYLALVLAWANAAVGFSLHELDDPFGTWLGSVLMAVFVVALIATLVVVPLWGIKSVAVTDSRREPLTHQDSC